MAKFDPYIRHVLKTIYDDNFVEEIIELTDEILPLIIKGDISLFETNLQNNELLSSLELHEIEFYKTLTFDIDVDGIRNKIGFNKLTILSMFLDQDVQKFLNDIPSDFTQASIQLDQISKSFNNNLRYFKYINQVKNGFTKYLVDLSGDKNIAYRFFNLIFNRMTDITDTGKISFVYLYSFLLLYQGYSKLTKYQSHIYYHIMDNERLTPSDIAEQMRDYYTDNQVTLINTVEEYCYRNIFKFSSDYTTLFDTNIDTKLGNSFSNLITIFEDNILELTVKNKFLTQLISHCVEQTSYYTAITRLDDFYEHQSAMYDTDVFATLELDEDAAYQVIRGYVMDNIGELESIEYVAWQFNSTPIYFLNAYTVLHYQYTSNLLNDMQVPFVIEKWDNKFDFKSDRNDQYRQFLSDNHFVYDQKVIFRCGYYMFADLLSKFFEREDVTQWIIGDFFPTMLSAVNDNYLKRIDVYKHIDDIRHILQLVMIKDLFNDKMFQNYIRLLGSYMSSRIDIDYDPSFTDVTVDLIFDNYPKAEMEHFLNGLYKSAYVNNYLNALTSKYSI